MKINRSKFIQHLERLACSGQCTEVVFNDAFAASALTPDQLLLIDAPPMDGAEPLAEEVGVADLGLFTKALKMLPGEGNTGLEVDLYVNDNRLVIDDGSRGVQKLLIAAPKTIGTRIEEATVKKLFKAAAGSTEIPLSRSVLEGVRSAFSLYKAEEVEVQIGRTVAKVCVGTEKTHRAEFELGASESEEEYTLLFGKHLVDVFAVVTDFSSAKLIINGAAKPILIEDGDYTYMLSPRSRSADEAKGKGAVKADKKTEAPAEGGEAAKPRARGRRRAAAEE